MNLNSIRIRLTLWHLAVLAASMAVINLATWFALREILLRNETAVLQARLEACAEFIEHESLGDDLSALLEEAREYSTGLPAGHRLTVLSSDGAVLLQRGVDTPSPLIESGRFDIKGHAIRLELAAPLEGFRETLGALRWVMFLLFPALLAVGGAGGWWLARRSLRPVDEMIDEVRQLDARDLERRLSTPDNGDELQRLAETLNDLLSRVAASVRSTIRFTADAAHELRTPVAVVRAAAELALRRDRSPQSYRETLRTIERESVHTGDLLERLLMLARGDAGALDLSCDAVPVGAIVGAACTTADSLAEAKGVRLKWSAPERDWLVWADESALKRLFLILIDNAVKHTPKDGEVIVRLDSMSDCCLIEVQDTGEGIAPDSLPHVFDRFYRATSARERSNGAGLGLAIAKTIAHAHKGAIEARSDGVSGALFRVTLPFMGSDKTAPRRDSGS